MVADMFRRRQDNEKGHSLLQTAVGAIGQLQKGCSTGGALLGKGLFGVLARGFSSSHN